MADTEEDSYELLLSEYDSAAHRFFSDWSRKIAEAQGGIYSLVSKEPIEQLPDYSVALPGNGDLGGRPMEASAVATFTLGDVVNGNLDSLLSAIYVMAVEMEAQISSAIIDHISDVSHRAGNVVAGELSHDKVIDIIEQLEFSFDEDGNPNLHIVVNSAEAREKLLALGEPTTEQKARFDEVISRKKDEWNARRRSRSLPPRRD
jgi:hypothetical protein